MSPEFLEKVSLNIAVDNEMDIILHDVFETAVSVNNECFGLVETEVARLLVLTDELGKRASVCDDVNRSR